MALMGLAACGEPRRLPVVRVFAAASLEPMLAGLAREYEASSGVRVSLSGAASSTLARQIEAGARADIYISANLEWMDYLRNRGHLGGVNPSRLLGNRLALVARRGAAPGPVRFERDFDFALAWPGRLAMGDPAHVPAGAYAREALHALGWWDRISDRVVPTANVRGALRLVELGEADLGIVYLTDARFSREVRLLGSFPENSHSPIVYHAALLAQSGPDARGFLRYLHSPSAMARFVDMGFLALDPVGGGPGLPEKGESQAEPSQSGPDHLRREAALD